MKRDCLTNAIFCISIFCTSFGAFAAEGPNPCENAFIQSIVGKTFLLQKDLSEAIITDFYNLHPDVREKVEAAKAQISAAFLSNRDDSLIRDFHRISGEILLSSGTSGEVTVEEFSQFIEKTIAEYTEAIHYISDPRLEIENEDSEVIANADAKVKNLRKNLTLSKEFLMAFISRRNKAFIAPSSEIEENDPNHWGVLLTEKMRTEIGTMKGQLLDLQMKGQISAVRRDQLREKIKYYRGAYPEEDLPLTRLTGQNRSQYELEQFVKFMKEKGIQAGDPAATDNVNTEEFLDHMLKTQRDVIDRLNSLYPEYEWACEMVENRNLALEVRDTIRVLEGQNELLGDRKSQEEVFGQAVQYLKTFFSGLNISVADGVATREFNFDLYRDREFNVMSFVNDNNTTSSSDGDIRDEISAGIKKAQNRDIMVQDLVYASWAVGQTIQSLNPETVTAVFSANEISMNDFILSLRTLKGMGRTIEKVKPVPPILDFVIDDSLDILEEYQMNASDSNQDE